MEWMEKRRLDMIVHHALQALHIVVVPHRPNRPVLSNRMGKMHKCGKTGFKVSEDILVNFL
jgi:hypothetical protein